MEFPSIFSIYQTALALAQSKGHQTIVELYLMPIKTNSQIQHSKKKDQIMS